MQAYSNPARASDPHALPNVEVFHSDGWEGAGWYWWACFPGCLPDGDPVGPFRTEKEALQDAMEESAE